MPPASRVSYSAANLLPASDCDIFSSVKTLSFNQLKRQEARNRAMVRRVRRSPAAAALQQTVSLVGDGAKWRITNLNQVARAIAKWP